MGRLGYERLYIRCVLILQADPEVFPGGWTAGIYRERVFLKNFMLQRVIINLDKEFQ